MKFDDQVPEIEAALSRVVQTCRCGSDHHTLTNQYVRLPVSKDSTQPSPSNNNIPCAAVSCDKCGLTSLYSLKALGLKTS